MGWSHYSSDGTQKTANVSASVDLPIGSITTYGGSAAPTGWLICDGSLVSRTSFSELFSIIGTTYGAGDGSTTFGLPNLAGRVPVGKTSGGTFPALGATGGVESVTLSVTDIPDHAHGWSNTGAAATGAPAGAGDGPLRASATFDTSFRSTSTIYTSGTFGSAARGAQTGHSNLQPYQVVHYIIKAQNVAATTAADFQAARASYFCSGTNNITNSGSSQKVAFTGGSLTFDTDGFLDTTNQRFTIPAGLSGLYHISGTVSFDTSPTSTTGIRSASIFKNGSLQTAQQNDSTESTSAATFMNVQCYLQLAEGDYIELFAAQNSSVTPIDVGGSGTFLTIVRVAGLPTPTQTQEPQVRVTNSGTQSIPNGTDTALTFDTETFDTDSMHSTVSNTSRLTCQTPGLYHITGGAEFSTNATGLRACVIKINGSTPIGFGTSVPGSSVSSALNRLTANMIYRLSAGDYVEFMVHQTSGAALSTVALPIFAMVRVSA